MKITIQKHTIEVKFDYESLYYLSQLWKLKGVGEVPVYMSSGALDDVDGVVDMLYAVVQTRGAEKFEAITKNDVGNMVLQTPGVIQDTVKAFQDSFPAPAEGVGKQKAVKAK